MTPFRLQRVLDYRRQREEQLQQRLAVAVAARLRAEGELATLQAGEQRQRDALATLLSGGRVEAGRVRDGGLALEAQGRAVQTQQTAIGRQLAFEQEERERLTAAMVERKALDRLRERHEQRERERERRQEGLLLEAIAARQAIAAREGRGR